MGRAKFEQLRLDRHSWGGFRPDAGRKKNSGGPVPHRARPVFATRYPLHITTRFVRGLPSARRGIVFRVIRVAFRDKKVREGFRLVHFSVQSNHLHLLVEAVDNGHLARGLQSVLITIAKRLNRWWGRKGQVIDERYHGRLLRTPREVRHALAYVLCNARRHGVHWGTGGPDPCSSGRWFDGWCEIGSAVADFSSPVALARTWLLSTGWKLCGRLSLAAVPGSG